MTSGPHLSAAAARDAAWWAGPASVRARGRKVARAGGERDREKQGNGPAFGPKRKKILLGFLF